MRVFDFLIEYSQGRTLKQAGEKLVARWKSGGEEYKDQMAFDENNEIRPESILHWIEQQDPSPDNKYTEWLVIRFIKDIGIHLHDLESQAKPELEKYIIYLTKDKIPDEFKNIQQVTSVAHLSEIIRGVEENEGRQSQEIETVKKIVTDQAIADKSKFEVVFDSPQIRVIIPMTFEMANFIYKQIKCQWCITHNQNFWNQYKINIKTNPAFFINNKKSNDWWVWVPAARSPQYRDINDKLLTPDEIHQFNKTHKSAANAIIKRAGGLSKLARNHPLYWFRYIKNPSKKLQLAVIKQDGKVIEYIENPSEEMQWASIEQDGRAIQFIKNPSEEMQWAAVKQNGHAIQYIENPTGRMKWAAIKQNGWVIQHIENPSEKIQLAAVKRNGWVIQHIQNPSEEVQLAAIKESGHAIKYIKNPSEEIKLMAVKQNGWTIEYIENPSEVVQLAAVKESGHAIKVIKNPSEEIKLTAVKQNGWPIEYIKNPSEEIKLTAVKQNGRAIKVIKNPSEEIKLTAVEQNGLAIEYIENPSEETQWVAVKQSGTAIEYIENPSEEMQWAAVEQSGYAIRYIKDPSEEMKLTAVKQTKGAIYDIDNPSEEVRKAAQRYNESIDFNLNRLRLLSGIT